MRNLLRVVLIIVMVMLLSGGLVGRVYAGGDVGTGTAASCTEAELDRALRGGGSITFNCGGAATIINLTNQKTITSDTTLDGANLITLSGGNATRLFLVTNAKTLTLNNLTLTNGYVNADGGAIYNQNGTLILNHSTIQNSQTTTNGSGGAIVSYGGLTITDSLFVKNRAANGGALYVRSGQATIRNSVLRENATTSTTDGWGGALFLWDNVRVDIEGGEIAYNTARLGGGIHNRFATSSVTLHDGTNIHNNEATTGGGIYNLSGTATLTNVTLQSNLVTATTGNSGGGGIYNDGGTATLTNVTLQGNSVTTSTTGYGSGGGIYNLSGTTTLTNVTLQGNSATTIVNHFGTVRLTYVTLQGTTGGIFNIISPANHSYLTNTVMADSGGNCSGQAPDSATFSLSTDMTCVSSGGGNFQNKLALLGPLQDNGGGMLTLLPQPKSLLIDGGQCVAVVTTDQRGVRRPQGAACDIGAVEVEVAPPRTPTPTLTVAPSSTPTTPSATPTTVDATPTTPPSSPTSIDPTATPTMQPSTPTPPPSSPTTIDSSPTAIVQPSSTPTTPAATPTTVPPSPTIVPSLTAVPVPATPTSLSEPPRAVFIPLVQQ
ncbi:MAG: choice-of-anchor Q domain-containing protein [Herpetosiphon sp.]